MPSPARVTTDASPRRDARGQVVVIFAGAMLLFVLLAATVIDLSWFWTNNLRMQRAADAAALAGVIFLPANEPRAIQVANEEAEKNGYENGVGGVTVTASKDETNDRVLLVSIEGPVGTYFARAVGITSWTAKRDAKAEYVLPVPMGSPQNYFGVGFFRDAEDTTTQVPNTPTNSDQDTGLRQPSGTAPPSGLWTVFPTGGGRTITSVVTSNNDEWARAATNGHAQQWANFGLSIPAPGANQTVTIRGIEVVLTDAFLTGGTCSNSQVQASLSWNGGSNFSSVISTPNLGTNANTDYTLPASGGSSSTAAWGGHTWVRTEFTDALFRVRLQFAKGCGTARQVNLDQLQVRVYYRITTQTYTAVTTTQVVDRSVISPYGQVLDPQNFWGAMQSQGAPNLQGDAYMTKYDTRTGKVPNGNNNTDPDAEYSYEDYYSYAVEMPPNSSGGEVWIFDPGFCDASTASGTGENWTVQGSNSGGIQPSSVSAFYTLEDAGTNLFDPGDDGTVYSVSSGNTFRQMAFTDRAVITELQTTNEALEGDPDYDNDRSSGGDCGSASWHYDVNSWDDAPTLPRRGWYLLGSGLTGGPGGTTYRLHTYSTDLSSLGNQDNSTGLNAFAVYTQAAGAAVPRVYGIGAMEAYVRLPGGRSSEFYLAQIEDTHAGKTMVINLWDPGDTGNLSANLEILAPGASSYTPVTFSYDATLGTTDAGASNGSGGRPDCRNFQSAAATSVQTNTGGSSRFNGCWLTIQVEIPPTYTAPHPTSDAVTTEGGWWKIRYGMGGASSTFSTDLTTWQVDIRGNPVHLVLP